MEEKQIQTPKLIQMSGSYNYKMFIPDEVEKKIKFLCNKIPNTEWSGVLFFTYEGTFENNDLVIKCADLYVMDIGSAGYTEFDISPDIASYMAQNPELLDCQMGLIHSHHAMPTFFSGTDTATLREEGADRNNFVSLIVNNAGNYTAAITRKTTSTEIKKSINYNFFNEGQKSDTKESFSSTEEIEWATLKIEKETKDIDFPDISGRIEEIKAQKTNSFTTTVYKCNYPSIIETKISNAKQEHIQDELVSNPKPTIPPSKLETVNTIVKQLVTSSILLPNESKIDVNKWAKNMSYLYEKRFGKGEDGLENFRIWAELYVDYLTWNIEDEELTSGGYDHTEIQSIYSEYIIEVLERLPENNYIDIYIQELEKFIDYGRDDTAVS